MRIPLLASLLTGLAWAAPVPGLDPEVIRRVIKMQIGDVQRCYEQGLSKRPNLAGRVVLDATIGAAGTIVSSKIASSTLDDRAVEGCIVASSRRWRFPRSAGGIVNFTYPFILKSAFHLSGGKSVDCRNSMLGCPGNR